MPNYRRAYRPGGTFFFTLVTYGRAPFLCEELARTMLHEAIAACGRNHPFAIDAMVLLPDHLHTIWTLPDNDADFSTRFAVLKKGFTERWISGGGCEGRISGSRQRNRRRGVWQRRFWEHAIRDQNDYNNHVNYIHYNPVKHGHSACPHTWPYSTFRRWCELDRYRREWCCVCDGSIVAPLVFDGLDESAME
jgi:putative transposase